MRDWKPIPVQAGRIELQNDRFVFNAENDRGEALEGAQITDTAYEWRINEIVIYVGETDQTVYNRHVVGGQHIRDLNNPEGRRRGQLIALLNQNECAVVDVFAYELQRYQVQFFGHRATPREALERALIEIHDPPLNA